MIFAPRQISRTNTVCWYSRPSATRHCICCRMPSPTRWNVHHTFCFFLSVALLVSTSSGDRGYLPVVSSTRTDPSLHPFNQDEAMRNLADWQVHTYQHLLKIHASQVRNALFDSPFIQRTCFNVLLNIHPMLQPPTLLQVPLSVACVCVLFSNATFCVNLSSACVFVCGISPT
jgi:hypothetical protein